MTKFYILIKDIFIKVLSTGFVIKRVFEHQFHIAMEIFVILRDPKAPKIAAMTS